VAVSKAWKSFEQKLCARLQAIVGSVQELGLAGIVTSTGRVGHLTSLGIDGIVGDNRNGLVIEAKRRKMPKWFQDAVEQISVISGKFGRYPVLGFSLAPDFGRKQKIEGQVLHREWVSIPLEFFEELLSDRMQVDWDRR
jgi:hypothetical protein